MKKLIYILGTVAAMLSAIGQLFKVQHWPGGGILISLGLVLLAIFFPLFAYYHYNKTE